jgi:hypothetical protein
MVVLGIASGIQIWFSGNPGKIFRERFWPRSSNGKRMGIKSFD